MTSGPTGEIPVFREIQRFRQIWIWILIGGIAGIAWYSLFRQIIIGEPFGSNPAPDAGVMVIFIIFGIIFPVWFLVMKLEIQVTSTILRFRMVPLHMKWREVPFGNIADVVAVIYRPIREYGGWGIRFGRKGIAYNVSGDRGVQVTLKNGKSFLLGSGRAEELAIVLRSRIKTGEH
ncbi:MAG: DUF6141 family protein [Methanoregulaceae archaeon]|nr:DUF6141 family protein [Methanoregulaceae archaeon]